jgi:hypothetical protein
MILDGATARLGRLVEAMAVDAAVTRVVPESDGGVLNLYIADSPHFAEAPGPCIKLPPPPGGREVVSPHGRGNDMASVLAGMAGDRAADDAGRWPLLLAEDLALFMERMLVRVAQVTAAAPPSTATPVAHDDAATNSAAGSDPSAGRPRSRTLPPVGEAEEAQAAASSARDARDPLSRRLASTRTASSGTGAADETRADAATAAAAPPSPPPPVPRRVSGSGGRPSLSVVTVQRSSGAAAATQLPWPTLAVVHIDALQGVRHDPLYFAFYLRALQLRTASVALLTMAERVCFFLNVAMTLQVHGALALGRPVCCFDRCCAALPSYVIGGEALTVDNIWGTILRLPTTAAAATSGGSGFAGRAWTLAFYEPDAVDVSGPGTPASSVVSPSSGGGGGTGPTALSASHSLPPAPQPLRDCLPHSWSVLLYFARLECTRAWPHLVVFRPTTLEEVRVHLVRGWAAYRVLSHHSWVARHRR